jgi:hypothetical protein
MIECYNTQYHIKLGPLHESISRTQSYPPLSSPHSHSAVSCQNIIRISSKKSAVRHYRWRQFRCFVAHWRRCEDLTSWRFVISDILLPQTSAHYVLADWSLVNVIGCPHSLSYCSESVLQVAMNDLSILPHRCNTPSATRMTIGCAPSALNTLLQSACCSKWFIFCLTAWTA